MRVNGLADESGISVLMVSVSIIALFGSASIAVDLGNLWMTRRHVIVAAAAAALAAASDYAVGQDGCAVAPDYVSRNDSDATLTGCGGVPTGPTSGYVTVDAQTPVDYAFAGVIGFPDRPVDAGTAAAWGVPAGVAGLRPFGLCKDDPSFAAWAANPSGISPPARVPYTNNPTDCGGAPGNWGIIDLDDVRPVANDDIKEWTRYGYPGFVRPGHVGGDTGALSNSLDDALAAVRQQRFPIPVFDRVVGEGSNARFHIIGFVGIQLVNWKTTGAEQTRYLEVRFTEMVASGECCDPGATDYGLRAVHICEVDPSFDPAHCQS
ncbi:MAG: hypothetical protein HYU28_10565 [Actinobacteria bacterium]|nr:hypothetical protein [Actinomycetota bacterium]